MKNVSNDAISRRKYWVEKIKNLSFNFENNVENLEYGPKEEIKKYGFSILVNHLRLCGNIPEAYQQDSSEEKLYSKYTDYLLAFAYQAIGLKSIVLSERTDVADVEAFGKQYSFIADAKAFRLSRTAKNQKDFKVQSMDNWKRGKPYAMVVCPIHQLPHRSSQIYQQAINRNVCIFTYSHLSLLVNYAISEGKRKGEDLLFQIFETISTLNPSKSAVHYWQAINKEMLGFSKKLDSFWKIEKQSAMESIQISKEEGLCFLHSEREKIMRMSHEEVLKEFLKMNKLESKIKIIQSVNENGLFSV